MSYKSLFSYPPYWAHRFGPAPYLPTSRSEMEDLGWDSCDVIIVSGDAYVDHPSFGMAVIGRLLESHGFRVGIIAQPDWQDSQSYQLLGPPNLFFGVTAGNMDSMVNRYTSDRKIRSDDAYTPAGKGGSRPDRSSIVYAQRCRQAYKGIPIILGGIEASLRRLAHFDYWSEKVRRSILFDSKADMLVYGNGERQVVEIAHRLAKGEKIHQLGDIRGTALVVDHLKEEQLIPFDQASTNRDLQGIVELPSFEQIKDNSDLYAQCSRQFHLETNPYNARTMVQGHHDKYLWHNPPAWPLKTPELDRVFELPYRRQPHPSYGKRKIPAYEMIRFSINIMRGCFGGCSFCSITEHEGRIIQSRSSKSILREVETIRDNVPGFTGVISDLGGPTANMYRMACKNREIESNCRRLSCVHPSICKQLNTSHKELIELYQKTRELPGIKKVLIASGLRYDLAVRDKKYVKELVSHHVGGYLKIAPEHTEAGPLSKMMKPSMDSYYEFKKLFEEYSNQAGKEQYLIPYFIAAHPGTTDEDMMNLAIWLKQNDFRADQVQNFLPSPMALATTMYHTGRNPLRRIQGGETVISPKGLRQRRLHKAFLRYHDPDNWPLLRQALKRMGRQDLIGNGKQHLVPKDLVRSTDRRNKTGQSKSKQYRSFRSQHTGLHQGKRR